MKTTVHQRYTRYFLLLNLFGFFFASAAALDAESADERSRCGGACIMSSCSAPESSTGFNYDLQPILAVAVIHAAQADIATDDVEVVPADTHLLGEVGVPTLAVAPKQSPPAHA
jgi:hypothetical protein